MHSPCRSIESSSLTESDGVQHREFDGFFKFLILVVYDWNAKHVAARVRCRVHGRWRRRQELKSRATVETTRWYGVCPGIANIRISANRSLASPSEKNTICPIHAYSRLYQIYIILERQTHCIISYSIHDVGGLRMWCRSANYILTNRLFTDAWCGIAASFGLIE